MKRVIAWLPLTAALVGLFCSTDRQPPTVQITFPPNGATVGEKVDVTADATDNRGVRRVDFYIDGVIAGSDSVAPFGFTWITAALPDSTTHSAYAKAVDYQKNEGMSAVITVLVHHGNCAPVILAVRKQTARMAAESVGLFAVRTVDPNGDSTWARLAWGDGDSTNWMPCRDSDWTDTVGHVWHAAATYALRAQARDACGALSVWSAACSLRVFSGPDQPPVVGVTTGPDSGAPQMPYAFVSTATDPDGDSVRLRFAWDDGDTSGWGTMRASGSPDTGLHSWTSHGTFDVSTEAMDVYGLVSTAWHQSRIVILNGSLVVNSSPSNAACYLDGTDVGRTSIRIDSVPPGLHKVKLTLTGYLNWEDDSVLIADGQTTTVNAVLQPSGPTHHSGEIDTNETWSPFGNPHVIDASVHVNNNKILTIMPGCVVRFTSGTELQCGYASSGAIVASGKPDSTILFTSDAATRSRGDWQDVAICQYAMSTTRFTYCVFEYGGQLASGRGETYVRDNNVAKIDHCKIWRSGDCGIVFYAAASGLTSFTSDSITSCASYPVSSYPQNVGSIGGGNSFTGNATDGILVQGGTGSDGIRTSTTWADLGVPYVIAGGVEVNDPSGPTLTISPGTTIKLQSGVELYCGYSNPGAIVADGSSARITFTSAAEYPTPGDWKDIGVYSYARSTVFRNCRFEYGGQSGSGHGEVYILTRAENI